MSEQDISFEDSSDGGVLHYEPPPYDRRTNYYSLFWVSYLDNEKILHDIQEVAAENMKMLNAICNMEDFYDTSLIPKMMSFPQQYISRITYNLSKDAEKTPSQEPGSEQPPSSHAPEEPLLDPSPAKTPVKDTATLASTPDLGSKSQPKKEGSASHRKAEAKQEERIEKALASLEASDSSQDRKLLLRRQQTVEP